MAALPKKDTWGVINRYVDKVWQGRDHRANAERFKARLFAGLLVQCDGYRIGSVHRIFCPLTVMSFLGQLNRGTTLEKLSFDKCRFWTDTGRLPLLQPIKPDSVDDLKRYISHLVVAFDRQAAYRRASDVVTRLQRANSLDAVTIDQIASQSSEPNELGFGGDTEAELVKICMVDRARLVDELLTGERLTAATIVQLLYQAGYLAPVTKDRVAIPCKEILDDIVWFYAKLAEDYKLNPNIRDALVR
ncbi:hypothetical protein H4R21_001081 [Coemansia helicoidea]|uniref:Uncharacterized protein n=1 Tax=Coemansia helicoidea TaxID=1286919 RepID=A0ACC1LDQ0_9FUNG|nr:hypothetical protein H4R21_001081 [Coemansia helicoidea]